jgi:hypothetical protein
MSRRTETAYKAQSPGKSAPHGKAMDSGDRVKEIPKPAVGKRLKDQGLLSVKELWVYPVE